MMATANKAPKLQSLDDLFGLQNVSGENTPNGIAFDNALKLGVTLPYPNHKFRLYQGERLDDMVESIKRHGVMQPILVRPQGRRYEILSGHNRVNAAKIAELDSIPALILQDILDEDAEAYVIETNLMQRGFSELSHSEKAAVIALHHSKMFSQGKRNDIVKQLEMIEKATVGGQNATSSQVETKLRSDVVIGIEYGLSRNTIARYLRINKLICTLQEKLDEGLIAFIPAVTLSFLSIGEQEQVDQCIELNNFKVDMKKADLLRACSQAKQLDEDNVYLILSGEKSEKKKANRTPTIGKSTYRKYFQPGQSDKEIQEIVERALALYYEMQKES